MPFGTRDLRAFCRQMGADTPVTFRAVSTYPDGQPVLGIFDDAIKVSLQEGGFGGVEASMPQLRLPFNAFSPMPASGDSLIVAGTRYTVNEPTAEDDGAFLVYELLEA